MSRLPVVSINGLSADSLGAYLSALGLFSLATGKWRSVRACWRNARFCLVGGPATPERIVEFVSEVGETNGWTPYDKPWDEDKKADVGKKVSTRTARWRALEAEERSLPAFGAHLTLDGRIRMNPLLGTGGNAGRRKFDSGWKRAVKMIEKPHGKITRESLNDDLKAFLEGQAYMHLGDFSAGSWFGAANKIYNHGTKKAYRGGEVTPWAMALACEGLPYFAGGTSRQLGSRRQPKGAFPFRGAFPFITTAVSPKAEKEAGNVEAEVWAPIWKQPMTEPELRSLFLRGRTELGGRGAVSSSTFAGAVMGRGIDAGVSEFRRFLLLHTTSAQTFESRLATVVPVPTTNPDSAMTGAIEKIVEFRDALPSDRKVGKRWRFSGLRGPLEQALVDFAAMERGEGRTEQAWTLVDEMIEALAKVDRNRTFRRANVRFRLLPGEWATRLIHQAGPPDREARLALVISSLAGAGPVFPQLIAYRIGVRKRKNGSRWEFPESPPACRVWKDAQLTGNLCAVAERRVMDASRVAAPQPPFDAAVRVGLDDIHAWLVNDVDEERMRLWLDRLCVFDWDGKENRAAARELQHSFPSPRPVVDGAMALYALFRPLASNWLFRQVLPEGNIQAEINSTGAHLGRVMAMLRHGDLNAAIDMARVAYRSAGVALADFDAFADGPDPDRLLAALIIPARDGQVLDVFRRWRLPAQPGNQRGDTHERSSA